jgi:hypothetical protein
LARFAPSKRLSPSGTNRIGSNAATGRDAPAKTQRQIIPDQTDE